MTNISFRVFGFAAASLLAVAFTAPASAAFVTGSQASAVDNYYGNGDESFMRSQARSTVRQGVTTGQKQAEEQSDTNGLHNW